MLEGPSRFIAQVSGRPVSIQPLVLIGRGFHLKAVESAALAPDPDLCELWTDLGVEPVFVHAEESRCVAEPDEARLNRVAHGSIVLWYRYIGLQVFVFEVVRNTAANVWITLRACRAVRDKVGRAAPRPEQPDCGQRGDSIGGIAGPMR